MQTQEIETPMLNRPFPELKTPRLHLRELRLADAEAIFRIFANDAVTEFYDCATFQRMEQAVAMTQGYMNRFAQQRGIRWGITLANSNEFIGTCGYNGWTSSSFHSDIGYALAYPYWGQGLMTEAVAAMVDYGFTQMRLNRIEAWVMPGNHASVRLLQKLGFQVEGVLRQRGYWKEAFHDVILFSLLRNEAKAEILLNPVTHA